MEEQILAHLNYVSFGAGNTINDSIGLVLSLDHFYKQNKKIM